MSTVLPMKDDRVQIRARGWNYFLEEQIPLRWTPPLRRWFPRGSEDFVDWIWKFFQFIFPMDDPRLFPPTFTAAWNEGERAVLRRYLTHAEDLWRPPPS